MATKIKQDKAPKASHPMQEIADGGAVQITKAPEQPAQDAKAWAKDFTLRVFALADAQRTNWLTLALEMANHPIDHRATMIADVKAHMEKRRAAVSLMSDDADTLKAEKAKLASSVVRISQLTKIATAFNSGGSIKACADTLAKSVADVTFDDLYAYAKGVAGSSATRTPDSLKVALKKFLDKRQQNVQFTDTDQVNYTRLVQFMEQLQD